MLKLLLVLAAVAAIAVAAPSNTFEFQDLDDSDAGDLLAQMEDELDLDDETSGTHGTPGGSPPPTPPSGTPLPTCSRSQSCTPGFFEVPGFNGGCMLCPQDRNSRPQSSSYGMPGQIVNCGANSCFPCPEQAPFNVESKMCLTAAQASPVVAGCITASMTGQDFCYQTNSQSGVSMASASNIQLKSPEQYLEVEESMDDSTKMAVKGCSTDAVCCAAGFYGDSSRSCTKCPPSKPVSSWSIPGNDCKCPNTSEKDCFPCTDLCQPYNSFTKVCTWKRCASGKSCQTDGSCK